MIFHKFSFHLALALLLISLKPVWADILLKPVWADLGKDMLNEPKSVKMTYIVNVWAFTLSCLISTEGKF